MSGLSDGNPASDYRRWIARALGSSDHNEQWLDSALPPEPQLAASPYAQHNRPTEVRAQPEPIWPPQSWWDARGVMPSTQDRIGQAQALTSNALDFWGIPSAVLSKVAPQADKDLASIRASHPTASGVGAVAGALGSFAPVRAIGNSLAARGHGRIAQAGADAGTMVGLGTASDVIRDGAPDGISSHMAMQMAPVAVMQRAFMPNLPSSLVARTAIGAGVGTIPTMFDMTTRGNWQNTAVGGLTGGLMAAAGRPSPRLPSAQSTRGAWDHGMKREGIRQSAMIPTAIAGPAVLGSVLYGEWSPDTPATTPGASEWDMWRHQKEPLEYPRPSPVFPDDIAYAEPSYPPMSNILARHRLTAALRNEP